MKCKVALSSADLYDKVVWWRHHTTITDNKFVFNCHFCACSMLMGFISLCLQGFKQQALAVSTDPEHRFELALQLGELKIAYQLAVEAEVSVY